MQERTDWAVWAHGRLQGAVAAATLAERQAHASRSAILEMDALRVDLNVQLKQARRCRRLVSAWAGLMFEGGAVGLRVTVRRALQSFWYATIKSSDKPL